MNPVSRASRKLNVNQENDLDWSKPRHIQCAAKEFWNGPVWFDYDNDGRLDLFVGRFVDFSKELNKPCGIHKDGRRHYCIFKVYSPMPSWLFHNNGDGTFTDLSRESGIATQLGKVWDGSRLTSTTTD